MTNPTEMNTLKAFWPWFLKMLQQQGLSFVLLAVAVYFLNAKLERVEAENRECRKEMVVMLKDVIEENTETLSAIKNYLSK